MFLFIKGAGRAGAGGRRPLAGGSWEVGLGRGCRAERERRPPGAPRTCVCRSGLHSPTQLSSQCCLLLCAALHFVACVHLRDGATSALRDLPHYNDHRRPLDKYLQHKPHAGVLGQPHAGPCRSVAPDSATGPMTARRTASSCILVWAHRRLSLQNGPWLGKRWVTRCGSFQL